MSDEHGRNNAVAAKKRVISLELRLNFGEQATGPSQKKIAAIEDVGDIGQRFATKLQLLWTFVTKIGTVAQATSVTNVAMLLALMAELKSGTPAKEQLATADVRLEIEDDDGGKTSVSVSVPVTEQRHIKTFQDHITYDKAALKILHEAAVQQMVNAYESLMADLVRRYIFEHTDNAAKDRSITYQELLEYGSLEEAQRKVVETQVTEFVRNNNTPGHLAYLKKELGIDVKSNFHEVDVYRELTLRRHAVVHAGGVVTAEYLRRLKEIPGKHELPSEGDDLDLGPAYVKKAWEAVYALGVVTAHLAGQRDGRDRKDRDAEEAIDYFLINAAYWAIEQRRYHAAEMILAYASKPRLSRDTCERMVAINLAQCHRWSGKPDLCRQVIEKYDWTASSSRFRLAAEVLCDGPEVEKFLVRAVADGELSIEDVHTWPLFREFRDKPEFPDLLKAAFGAEAAARPENRFAASLLDFDFEKTAARFAAMVKGIGVTPDDASAVARGPSTDSSIH